MKREFNEFKECYEQRKEIFKKHKGSKEEKLQFIQRMKEHLLLEFFKSGLMTRMVNGILSLGEYDQRRSVYIYRSSGWMFLVKEASIGYNTKIEDYDNMVSLNIYEGEMDVCWAVTKAMYRMLENPLGNVKEMEKQVKDELLYFVPGDWMNPAKGLITAYERQQRALKDEERQKEVELLVRQLKLGD